MQQQLTTRRLTTRRLTARRLTARRRLRGGSRLAVVAASSLLAVAVACSKSDTTPGGSGSPVRWIDASARRITEGQQLFATCAACHGQAGEGKLGIAPRLNSQTFLEAASDDFLVRSVTEGRAGTTMVGWGKTMPAGQIQSLVAYIRSLRPTNPVALDPAPLNGDPERGAVIFRDICSACHGRNGGGYQEAANGTGIGREAYLNNATNGYLRHLITHGKEQTPMRPFGVGEKTAVANLTAQQIDDVIAYLRKNAW